MIFPGISSKSRYIENKRSSIWQLCCHWWHHKLYNLRCHQWQKKLSNWWPFVFSDMYCFYAEKTPKSVSSISDSHDWWPIGQAVGDSPWALPLVVKGSQWLAWGLNLTTAADIEPRARLWSPAATYKSMYQAQPLRKRLSRWREYIS